jgi:hypothetical protein
MRKLLIALVCISFVNASIKAQIKKGFVPQEAMDMIKLCNSFSHIELYDDDSEILPNNYKKKYTSGVFGMDNKFQIYEGPNKTAVINLRGSTEKKISWMENLYASMIPAQGLIEVNDEKINYLFAKDSNANVHSGYALGIAFLSRDLLFHINNLNDKGIYSIYLTGHSQGGALAQMLMAYLSNLKGNEISIKNKFKTYSFAAPKVGNTAFVQEYNELFSKTGMSYLILNPADPVHRMPMSYEEGKLISKEEIARILTKESEFNFKKFAINKITNILENPLEKTSAWFSKNVGKQISKDLGDYKIPPFTSDINYGQVGNVKMLHPVEYPVYLRDSSILENDSLMAIYKRDENGVFEDESLYAKGKQFYQHKPYNYYMAFLRMYFPELYTKTEPKFLIETL